MNEENAVNETTATNTKVNPKTKKAIIYASVLVIVFLIGLIPMWLTARERADRLSALQRELKLAQIENTIASAVIDARRAEYEPARQTASNFFTTVLAEIERGKESVLTESQRETMRPVLTQRDTVITLLARSDPASVERLSDLYFTYRKAVRGF